MKAQINQETAALLGFHHVSSIDLPLAVTVFPSRSGQRLKRQAMTLRDLADWIGTQEADDKAHLPLLKLATFGSARTPLREHRGKRVGNSLRHNANVLSVSGCELDYDEGTMTPEEAASAFRAAGVAALVYTTPSDGLPGKGRRWRALLPFSTDLPPEDRAQHLARANGILGGVIDRASFTLSQTFYAGRETGGAPVQSILTEGQPIDLLDDLDAGAAWPDGAAVVWNGSTGRDSTYPPEIIRGMVSAIENNDRFKERGPWIKVIAAIRKCLGDDGWQVALDWSLSWSGTPPVGADPVQDFSDAWDSLSEPRAGAGTLLRYAARDGYALPAEWRAEKAGAALDSVLDDDPTADPEVAAVLGFDDGPSEGNPLAGHEANHNGVINAFTEAHAGEMLFDQRRSRWHHFDGTHWKPEETNLAYRFARRVTLAVARIDDSADKTLKSVPFWEAVERGARRELTIEPGIWDRDKMLLGTPGGTIELTTGRLCKADPSDFVSKVTTAAPVPLNAFDPARDCPEWLAFLDYAQHGDAETIRFFQRWAGYCLTGETREQVLLFIHGTGGTGKSTAANVLMTALADYATGVDASTLTQRKHDAHLQELARLDGPRLAVTTETARGSKWNEQRIKMLTGEDPITANHMRENAFTFYSRAKLTIVGNYAPDLTDVDDAMRRRFLILPFNRKPVQKDEHLPARLRAEMPGILSWMIQGCLDWQQQGLNPPEAVKAATADYFAEQDTFGRWLAECCDTGVGMAETTDDLFASWQQFAFASGGEPGSREKTFPETMKLRGFARVKAVPGKRTRGFRGIRLRRESHHSGLSVADRFTDDGE